MNPPQVPQDFELKAPNLLRTDKDFSIKELFVVTNSEVSMKRGQRLNRTTVSGAVNTISTGDFLIAVTSLAVAPSIGLPLPSYMGVGKHFIVKDEVGGAATTTITVRSDGEKTIDGASSATITTNYGSKAFYTDGVNWFTF